MSICLSVSYTTRQGEKFSRDSIMRLATATCDGYTIDRYDHRLVNIAGLWLQLFRALLLSTVAVLAR